MKKLLCLCLILCLVLSHAALGDDALNEKCLNQFKTVMMFIVGKTDANKAVSATVWGGEAYKTVYLYSLWNSWKAGTARFEDLAAEELSREGNELTLRITGKYVCSYREVDDCPYQLDYTVVYDVSGYPKIKTLRLSKNGESELLPSPDEGIKLEKIYRDRFVCYCLTVYDPARVYVGVGDEYFKHGLRIEEIAEKYGAVAAVNGNTFKDEGGSGNGGSPLGFIASQGKFLTPFSGAYPMALLCEDGSLQVGVFNQKQAEEMGVRDGVAFGPLLIKDGVKQNFNPTATGLNPRTVIGQNKDGAIVLLVADGRDADSPGASYDDMADLCLELDMVSALNLDGGPSSTMVIEGKQINGTGINSGFRAVPCAVLIAPAE